MNHWQTAFRRFKSRSPVSSTRRKQTFHFCALLLLLQLLHLRLRLLLLFFSRLLYKKVWLKPQTAVTFTNGKREKAKKRQKVFSNILNQTERNEKVFFWRQNLIDYFFGKQNLKFWVNCII